MAAALPLAILGAGSIGRRHIEVALACPAVDLACVIEPQEALRKTISDQGLVTTASLADAPAHIRAAIVATPTQDHHDSAMACLARGWATLVEKPIAATLAEADALIAAATAKGLPLFTGHHRRCHPFTIAARAAIADLGEVVGLQGLWSLRKHNSYFDVDWRRKPGAGPLLSNLSHEIDLLHFLLGDITEVTALLSSARRHLVVEDTAAMAFRFANGALGAFVMSDAGASPWAFEAATGENPAIAPSHQDYLFITGTRGALSFPSLTTWQASEAGEIEWSKPLKHIPGAAFARVDPLLEQITRFAAVADGGADDVLCTAAEGRQALALTLAAALSGHQNTPRTPADVPGDYRGI